MDTSTGECRLCLSQKELVLVFNCDGVGHKHMKELILLTTGVEILERDVVSRKICATCIQVVIKMHEFRERSIKTDKLLKEKCIEHLKATEMKIPNTDVTITTTKQLRTETLDDSYHNNNNLYQNELNEVDGSKKDENDSYSHNSNIPKKVKVHDTVSELFKRHPNLKLRTDVLVFDVNPFISLELDAVEKYCSDNNINLKLATERATDDKNISITNSSVETSISENKSYSPNNMENDQVQLKVSPISIKLVDDRTNFEVTPINIKYDDDHANFKVISNDSSKRKRESNESNKSNESITVTQQSKIKRRRLSSSDFISDTDERNPTLFETLELKPSQPSSKQKKTHKCNICLTIHKNAKTLKLHYQEHFCCSFCKARFRLVERRISHEKKCTIGHALNSKPYVELTRVDLDPNIRNKYLNCNSVINKNSLHSNEVIVLSDDEEPVEKSTTITNVTVVATESSSIEKVTNKCLTDLLNKVTTYYPAKYNTFLQSPTTISNNELLPQTEVPNTPAEVLPVQYSNTAIVRPDIRLQDDTLVGITNLKGSDNILLKDLLRHAKRVKHKSLKAPSTEDITRNGIMKNMFLQLALYKVPVNIRHGEHCVTISGQESNTNKEVTMWNDIKPLPLFNKKAHVDIKNITLKPSETVLTNSVKTNNPAKVQRSHSIPSVINGSISKIRQRLGSMLKSNTQYSKTHCSTQDQTMVSTPNILTQSSTTVTSPNGVQTIFSQHFTPNFLNTSNAHLLNSRNNTSPVNSNASSPQLIPHTPNNAVVNTATYNSRQEFIPLSNTLINPTNDISQVFRSSSVIMTGGNHRLILRPNNTSPLNRTANSPQIVPDTPNNAIVNNATNNSRLEFIPPSNTSINSTNDISQVFRSSDVIMPGVNHQSISRPNNTSPLNRNASSPQIVPHTLNNALVNNATNNCRQEFSRSNTSPLNRNAISPQIVPHTLNSSIVNNTTNNSQQELIPLSITSMNLTNSISQDFRSGGAVMTDSNHPSFLRSVSNPAVNDCNLTNYNRLSAAPNQKNVQYTYSNSNNQQITAPSLNNQRVILNPLVANGNARQYNNLQQNTLNTTSLMPNNNTNNNFTTSSIPYQTSALPNNFSSSRPMIRVKSLHELK
ncbi:uncharacterized protein [Diabrotica undecimpunctata]|uniref:uncharacterized protein isoform X1 n=1 Tax=Diabrotica undecimpunctata TaxID=50387 RepID=UPI003B639639